MWAYSTIHTFGKIAIPAMRLKVVWKIVIDYPFVKSAFAMFGAMLITIVIYVVQREKPFIELDFTTSADSTIIIEAL